MEYRRLGKSGLKVSALSFGAWVTFKNQLDLSRVKEMLTVAFDGGVNFFDNAEVYAAGAAEELMGTAIAELGWSRDRYCVSSKVFWGGKEPTQRGLSRKHVVEACHAALRRLQVDYLDLFFCHRPDVDTPIEETVRAMSDLVTQGKVLYWGTSEWDAQQITEAHAVARSCHLHPPTMEQPQYNMFHRNRVEREYEPLYRDHGLGTTIWSPLASGLLTGKYNEGIPEGSRLGLADFGWLKDQVLGEDRDIRVQQVRQLQEVAADLGITMARLAIAWCLQNPNVSTVILGATRVEQLQENLAAMDDLGKLDALTMQTIEGILQNRPPGLQRY